MHFSTLPILGFLTTLATAQFPFAFSEAFTATYIIGAPPSLIDIPGGIVGPSDPLLATRSTANMYAIRSSVNPWPAAQSLAPF